MRKSIIIIVFFYSLLIAGSCSGCGSRDSGRRSNLSNTARNKRTVAAEKNISGNRRSRHTETKISQSHNHTSQTANLPTIDVVSEDESDILKPTEIFKSFNSAVFMIIAYNGYNGSQGSGFFINERGLAVSNYHVFEGNSIEQAQIQLTDNTSYYIKKIISYDAELDYILFEVDLQDRSVNYIPVNFKLPQVGEKVYAIGSPKGLENTFSSGEISQIRDNHKIQISVPITHGSSGGALINSRGQVIGITTSGVGEANLNFAMSIKVIENIY